MNTLARYDSGISFYFDQAHTLDRWWHVELAALLALKETGTISQADFDAARAAMPQVAGPEFREAVDKREAEIGHDVAAFVDVMQAGSEPALRWIHYGLTSSDVVDTALHLGIADASAALDYDLIRLLASIKQLTADHVETLMAGRTHGQHAELTTFGRKMAIHGLALLSARERLHRAERRCRVGKLAGPVGTHSVFTAEQERIALKHLKLRRVRGTQVIGRDRIADMVFACAQLCGIIENIALDLRLLAQSEIREVGEGRNGVHKDSSSMPHKTNPVKGERLTGISRMVRAWVAPALENVALWNERDISHSSVERIMVPEVITLTDFAIVDCKAMLDGLYVDVVQMGARADEADTMSHVELCALIERGQSRDEAYRLVQNMAYHNNDGSDLAKALAAQTLVDSADVVRAYRKRLDKESRS